MKTITEQLVEMSQGIIKQYPEVRDEGKGYSMADDGGVELEVGEFLYAMVRILKPLHILETGTYTGISAMYMAQGLKDNNLSNSEFFTCDISQFHLDRARKLWEKVDVSNYIFSKQIESLKVEPARNDYDLMFLDSEPNLRYHELVRFFPYLKEGGYVFIHDVPRNFTQGNVNPDHPEIASWPFGDLPREIKNWVHLDQLRVFHLPNPRGMVGFYKPRKDDFKWI